MTPDGFHDKILDLWGNGINENKRLELCAHLNHMMDKSRRARRWLGIEYGYKVERWTFGHRRDGENFFAGGTEEKVPVDDPEHCFVRTLGMRVAHYLERYGWREVQKNIWENPNAGRI